MKVKISRIARFNNKDIGFTVKINYRKFPKGYSNFYFPEDHSQETAKNLAIMEYLELK